MKRIIVIGNDTQWCYYSWYYYAKEHNIKYYSHEMPLDLSSCFVYLCRKHFTPRINLPFKRIWYPLFIKSLNIKQDEDTIIIIYDRNVLTFEKDFIKLLRKKYSKLRLVYLFTNVARISGASDHNLLDELTFSYDMVFAFDKQDSIQYGFKYNPLIYTAKLPVTHDSCIKDSDLFYIGLAKDRLPVLLEIFEKAKKIGLKCDFNIVEVPKSDQKYSTEIKYNTPMKYIEVLQHIKHTKCIVDVIQGNSTGYTIKTAEALVLGRKLLTTNINIEREPFYSSDKILIYPQTDVNKEFILSAYGTINDVGRNYFSPENLINKIVNL